MLDCEDKGKHYRVYLVFGERKSGSAEQDLGLEVVDVLQGRRVRSAPGKKGGEYWAGWDLRLSTWWHTHIRVPKNDKDAHDWNFIDVICRKKKIEIDLSGWDGKTNKKIDLAINFNFGSIKSEGLDWKENDIVFATGSK